MIGPPKSTMFEQNPSVIQVRRSGSGVLLPALFLAVPLAAAPWFWDQFTTVKWYVLDLLALGGFALEIGRGRGCRSPSPLRQGWPARLCAVLAALVSLGALRHGVAWGAPVLLDRACFVLLSLLAFWHFGRNGLDTRGLAPPLGLALLVVSSVGMAQVLGADPLPRLTASDHRSAFFGNVNLAAQFVGLAIVLLLAGGARPRPARARALAREAVVLLGLTYLWFLSCRSVFLALSAALALLAANGRQSGRSLAARLAATALVVALIVGWGPLVGLRPVHLLSPEVLANKALSTQMRLGVWRATLSLVADHPLGVGSGGFRDAFVPYQLGLAVVPGDKLLFETPHNDYLRLLAEEGVVSTLTLVALLVLLWRRWCATAPRPDAPERVRAARALVASWAAFLAVEACFQFPFATAFGALAAAVVLGLGLAAGEVSGPASAGTRPAAGDGAPRGPRRWRLAGALLVAAALPVLAAVAASELLYVNRRTDLRALEMACSLNPRNLPACVTASWRRATAGDAARARGQLVAVLRRSPYYHPAILLLGQIADTQGDHEGACLYLWVYDELFRGRSAAHERAREACGGRIPVPPALAARMPFYGVLPLAPADTPAP